MYKIKGSFKERFLSIIIAISLMVTMMPLSMLSVYGADSTNDAELSYNGEQIIHGTTSYYPNMGKAKDVDYYYSDGYFKHNSSFYNEHLATSSIAMAMSTMNNNYVGKYAKAFLSDIGCNSISSIGYDNTKPTEDTVAAAFGYKTLFKGTNEECILVPIVLRSAFYDDEWINNFVVGENGDANGYAGAAAKVKTAIDSYVESLPSTENIKFWIAGYSRGGSIGNILGKLLSDEFGKESVYAYSFEAQKSAAAENAGDYKNLFVVNNYSDWLTLLYPDYMKFNFYGVEKNIATTDDLKNNEDAMLNQLAKINTASKDEYVSPKSFKYYKINNSKLKTLQSGGYLALWDLYEDVKDLEDEELIFAFIDKDNRTTTASSQRDCGELLVSRLHLKALIDRKAYVDNEIVNKNRDYKVNSAMIDSVTPYTVEKAAQSIVKFIEETDQDTLDKIIDNFENITDKYNSLAKLLAGLDDVQKVQAIITYLTSMKFTSEWSGNTYEAKYKNMVSYIWNYLNKTSGDYLSIDKMDEKGLINAHEVRASMPITLYTIAGYLSKDIGQTDDSRETAASLAMNFDSIAQAHYPEINFAWLCTKDSFYGGEKSAHTHNFNSKVELDKYLVKSGSCTEGATYYYSCECGLSSKGQIENEKTFTLDPKPHVIVNHEGKAASCTSEGWEPYETCENCDYTTYKAIPKLNHSLKHVKKAAGNCVDGYEYDLCESCNNKFNNKTLAGYSTYYVKSFKVTKGTKAFTAKWKKQSKANQKKFSGYQIRYSTKSSMAGCKYATAKKSASSKKISKLKKKTKYYVQVRTYRTVGGKKYYSKWSSKKSVKTK